MINKNGQAIKYFRSRVKSGINYDLNMFVEDLSNRIMPIGGASHYHKNFRVNITGSDKSMIGELFSDLVDAYDLSVEERLVSKLVREIGQKILWSGKSLFEITETDDSLYLFSFTSRNTFKIPFYYIQLIPVEDWNFFDKKINIISAKNVIQIGLPNELGNKRRHKTLVRKIRNSDPQFPKFWQETLQKNDLEFNLTDYRKSKDLYTLKLVKRWGWDKRGLANKHLNGFYQIYRTAQVAWAMAMLREHIVKELNKIFQTLNIDLSINIKGLPTANDIKKAQEHLINKEKDFEEISDLITTL